MSEIVVTHFKNTRIHQSHILGEIEDIFFESSEKKDFKTQKEKTDFQWKYLGFYLSHYPEFAWVAMGPNKVLGYILGMPLTQKQELYAIQPHLPAFEEFYQSYPAHLHINCHKDSRGQGVGKKLLSTLLNQFQDLKISGVHIMTGPNSENQFFYKKLGFQYEQVRHGILFLGKKLCNYSGP